MTYPINLAHIATDAPKRADAYEVMFYQLQYDDDLTDKVLDALVDEIAAPVLATIDCTDCGNCCRALDVYLESDDLARMSQCFDISIQDIQTRYVDTDVLPDSGAVGKFMGKPCGFLNGSHCTIYEHRPQACRDYPFLTPDFRWSMEQLIPGAALCPIIYHTLNMMLERVDTITSGQL